MNDQQLAHLRLADQVLAFLEHLPPAMVDVLAMSANHSMDTLGFVALKIAPQEIARRKLVASLRSKRVVLPPTQAEVAGMVAAVTNSKRKAAGNG